MFILYNVIGSLLLALGLIPFWVYGKISARSPKEFRERLGYYGDEIKISRKGTRIWIHAASVGEVWVARAIIEALLSMDSGLDIVLSTITATGNQTARDILKGKVQVIFFPLDHPWVVRRALKAVHPRLIVNLETEIWPNLIRRAKRSRIPLIMAHGRITERSFRKYLWLQRWIKNLLASFEIFSMIGNHEAQRIQALGADPARITVSGSAKLDGLYLRLKEEDGAHRFEKLNLGDRDLVWVAGSTRTGEEEILLEAYDHLIRSYPGLVLILVPRHLNRIRAIMRILAARGLKFELFSEIASAKASRSHPIVLVDRMGELFSLYRLADIVFCGASLVPKGGQNPLEPAAWGKVVLYGPHMEDFQEATGLLTNLGVGFIVEDGKELVTIMEKFLSDPMALKEMGKRGREIFQFKGAAMAHAKIIYEKLPKEITE